MPNDEYFEARDREREARIRHGAQSAEQEAVAA